MDCRVRGGMMDPYIALQPLTPVVNKCKIVTQCVEQRDAKVDIDINF